MLDLLNVARATLVSILAQIRAPALHAKLAQRAIKDPSLAFSVKLDILAILAVHQTARLVDHDVLPAKKG